MIANKNTATLENWQPWPDEENPTVFFGTVSNHPRQEEFLAPMQRTSYVVAWDRENGLLETRNTIYRLGERLPE